MGDLSACGTHRQAGADQSKLRAKSLKEIRTQKSVQRQSPCWRQGRPCKKRRIFVMERCFFLTWPFIG
ncbi:MAG: hypothetical protein DRG73_07545 [Deltaproteobacteria bacterium]|nr:MAG: hypothetical protein DRG73_07545 [Deltaproteobacteria bacterium]